MKALLPLAFLLAACAAPGGSWAPDYARFERIQPGMTPEETLRLIGAPDQRMNFPLSGTNAWDYRYQDAWGYSASFSVTFGPDGRVASTISTRLNDGGDHGM